MNEIMSVEEYRKLPSLKDAEPLELAKEIARVLDAHKGDDIAVLHVTDATDITDYFVLCSARSTTQVRSLTDELEYFIGERGVAPFASEGRGDKNSWMVIDYGCVIVHVFTRDARQFYNLDKLYSDSESINVEPRDIPEAN